MRSETHLLISALVSLLLGVSSSQAQWNPEIVSFTKETFPEEPMASSPIFMTLWGAALDLPLYFKARSAGIEKHFVPNPWLKAERQPVFLHIKREFSAAPLKKRAARKAKLVVIIPGLYGNGNAALELRFAAWLSQKGYHVGVIQSPWSLGFLYRRPKVTPGHYVDEAKMALYLVKEITKIIGPENVLETQLLGISYGAFLASVAKGLDQASGSPMIDGPTTLIGPPIQIGNTLNQIDGMLKDIESEIGKFCVANIRRVSLQINVISTYEENKIFPTVKRCASVILAQLGFYSLLKDLSLRLYDQGMLPWLEEKFPRRRDYRRWLKDITYNRYIKEIIRAPEVLLNGPISDIGYWVNLSRAHGYNGVRAISSKDDFLNEGLNPRKNKYFKFTEADWIDLPWGGHVGFKSIPWFESFLNNVF